MLKHIKEHGPIKRINGLCRSIELLCLNREVSVVDISPEDYLEVNRLMKDIFEKWPEFSGDRTFPISTHISLQAVDQYYYARKADYVWSTVHPYGQARWRLLDWMVDTLEAEVKDGA